MEKHTCKLCFKSFHNGRALGGHMRSHVTKPPLLLSFSSFSSSSFSTPAEEEGDDDDKESAKGTGISYRLRANPRKSSRVVDPEFSSYFAAIQGGDDGGFFSASVPDWESETESSIAPTVGRRSNRRRRRPPPDLLEPEPVSSVSDVTREEDVARCLMLLSRD